MHHDSLASYLNVEMLSYLLINGLLQAPQSVPCHLAAFQLPQYSPHLFIIQQNVTGVPAGFHQVLPAGAYPTLTVAANYLLNNLNMTWLTKFGLLTSSAYLAHMGFNILLSLCHCIIT